MVSSLFGLGFGASAYRCSTFTVYDIRYIDYGYTVISHIIWDRPTLDLISLRSVYDDTATSSYKHNIFHYNDMTFVTKGDSYNQHQPTVVGCKMKC